MVRLSGGRSHGLEAVLVAVELVLETGAVNAEHVLNVVGRLQHPDRVVESVATTMVLQHTPTSDTARYDGLREEADHVDA